MKAVVWEGKPYHVSVKEQPQPKLKASTDVIVRLTTAGICGTDLHTYHGNFGSPTPPWILGHEPLGIVTDVGDGVNNVHVGDRVVVTCDLLCGYCDHCIRGDHQYCLNVNPGQDFELFGLGPGFSPDANGAQAEYLRVPYADSTCYVLPPGRSNELDFLLISDIWGTAWSCLDYSGFQTGDSVAVFGAGPVGLLCAYTAILRGASQVYSIDHVPSRLERARSIGAIPIDFRSEDPPTRIMKDLPLGVRRSCDCVGYECVDPDLKPAENTVLNWAVASTGYTGGIGVIGVYAPSTGPTAGAPKSTLKTNNLVFPIADFWLKGLSMKGGAASIRHLFPAMRDLIVSGKAKPSFVITKEIGIDEAPEAYKNFSAHREQKYVIRFPWADHESETNGAKTKLANIKNGEESERKGKRARRS